MLSNNNDLMAFAKHRYLSLVDRQKVEQGFLPLHFNVEEEQTAIHSNHVCQ